MSRFGWIKQKTSKLASNLSQAVRKRSSPPTGLPQTENLLSDLPAQTDVQPASPPVEAEISHEPDHEESRFRTWLSGAILGAVKSISVESDRDEIVRWFLKSRDILSAEGSKAEITKALYRHVDMRRTFKIFWNCLITSLKSYKDSKLPLPIKVALPITAAGALMIGAKGAGIVAFGGAIGLPVALLLFLGTAGVTSIIEAFVKDDLASDPLTKMLLAIAVLENQRRISNALAEALRHEPIVPERLTLSADEQALQNELCSLDPFDFEKHVMSFFQAAGYPSIVTKKSKDFGIDGCANHPEGLMVVQCKRYAQGEKVGRPAIQQFKGVIEEEQARKGKVYRGYFVTTGEFTKEAVESAAINSRLVLVNLEELINWHREGKVPHYTSI